MGKTGGYSKKTSVTGSEKKTTKLGMREYRHAAGQREAAYKSIQQLSEGKDPLSKMLLEQFGPEGKAFTDTRSYEQAKQMFEPVRQQALTSFQQDVLPQIQGAYGRTSKTSSALNQALSQAATQLQGSLNAQFAPFYAQEMARQQDMLYNTLMNQQATRGQAYGALTQAGLPGAQLGLSREKFAFAPKSRPLAADIALGAVQGGAQGASQAAAMAAMA